MKQLTIDDLLSVDDVEIRKVEMPELGGFVYIRSMTLDRLEKIEEIEEGSRAAYMIGYSLCDEHGRFLNISDAQIEALGKKNPKTVNDVAQQVLEMNKMTSKAASEVEDALKKTHGGNT